MTKNGAFTPSSGGGSQQVTGLTSLPTFIRFIEAGESTTDTQGHFSYGSCWNNAGTMQQTVRSTFSDTTGSKSYYSNSKSIYHMKRVSGTITAVNDGIVTSFDTLGGGNFGFTINFTASATIPIAFEYE